MITLNNGNNIPAIGIGTWKSNPEELYYAIYHAIKVGYRHIDCAWIYGNEPIVGDAISAAIKDGLVTREELFITGKLWNNAHEADKVEAACNESLKNLQLDYLDLYLIHWPVASKELKSEFIALEEMPLENTWKGMEKLVTNGLVKSIGTSNFSIAKLQSILKVSDIKPAMNQVEVHPFLQQDELIDFCKSQDIMVTAYAPLGSFDRPDIMKMKDEPILIKNPLVLDIAKKHNITPAGVLLAWGLSRGICLIPKSTTPSRIEENLTAINITLDQKDIEKIQSLNLDYRFYTGVFFCVEGSPYTTQSIFS
jgi:alcohol dehydrogenase (NADP+)